VFWELTLLLVYMNHCPGERLLLLHIVNSVSQTQCFRTNYDTATPQAGKSNLQNLHLFPFMKEGPHPKTEKSFVSNSFGNKDTIRLSDIVTSLEGVFQQCNLQQFVGCPFPGIL